VRFETRRCSAPDPLTALSQAHLVRFGEGNRGIGEGEWKELGSEREWKGKERK